MDKQKKTSIGGQALIEGIMMRGPHKTVMSCRLPDGSISTEEIEWSSASKKCKFLRLPVIRGAVALVDSMINGYKALMLSAERSGMLDEEPEKTETDRAIEKPSEEISEETTEEVSEEISEEISEETVGESTGDAVESVSDDDGEPSPEIETAPETVPEKVPETAPEKKKESAFETILGIVSLLLGLALAIVLFMWLPSTAFNLINRIEGVNIDEFRALFEGTVKILIFVLYMFCVSFMKDIKRVFMYHGAEHKSIFCYEKGLELTVENVRMQKRFHPRCGTSFMILMLIVSILLSYLLTLIPAVSWLAQNYSIVWVIIKLLLLPLTCGIGYELIRISGRYDNIVTRIISAPGVWLQHVSTKEPDDSMIEIAIEALKAVIPENSEDDNW